MRNQSSVKTGLGRETKELLTPARMRCTSQGCVAGQKPENKKEKTQHHAICEKLKSKQNWSVSLKSERGSGACRRRPEGVGFSSGCWNVPDPDLGCGRPGASCTPHRQWLACHTPHCENNPGSLLDPPCGLDNLRFRGS